MRPVEAVLITIIVILLLFIQLNHQQLVVFRLMYERWANECLTILAAAMIRRRNRRRQRIARSPYAWSIPRPGESWFDLHHYDATIPEEFFRQQLRVRRNAFNRILNLLGHRLVRQPSRFRDPLPPEKKNSIGTLSPGSWELICNRWTVFQCWKSNRNWGRTRCGGSPLRNSQWVH